MSERPLTDAVMEAYVRALEGALDRLDRIRAHLAAEHPECPWTVMGILADAEARAVLVAERDEERTGR